MDYTPDIKRYKKSDKNKFEIFEHGSGQFLSINMLKNKDLITAEFLHRKGFVF